MAKFNAEEILKNESMPIDFRCGSLFEPWEGMKFDVVTANLPYLPDKREENKISHEPRVSLYGGRDGMDTYETFFSQAEKYLNSNGRIFIEISDDQTEYFILLANRYLPKYGYRVIKDLLGLDRVMMLESV